MTHAERFHRVEPHHPELPVTRQCELLAVARSTVYYPRRPLVSDDDLTLMRRLDEVHLQYPFLGSRRLRDALEQEGRFVNRKRIQRLMRLMGLETLHPKRKTSIPGKGHRIFPYLLRGLDITRPNQAWCTDITYIPMRQGFCYLIAIMDWASRAVLSWRLSTTMEADFCVEALEEAITRYGTPEIFNTDQGAQFTSEAFLGVLERGGPQPLDKISGSLSGLSAGLIKRPVPETPQHKLATVFVGPSALDDDGHYCRNRSIWQESAVLRESIRRP